MVKMTNEAIKLVYMTNYVTYLIKNIITPLNHAEFEVALNIFANKCAMKLILPYIGGKI